jgi:PHD/YefM family antitoxin component YafN of YafNO toxin-antitoxin module
MLPHPHDNFSGLVDKWHKIKPEVAMRYTSQPELEPKLAALLDAAQQGPVFIESGQQEVAVLVSVREYALLRSSANLEFQEFCDSVSDKAAARGLTAAGLDRLLKDA